MSQENRVEEVLNQVGLNWTVREEALTTESGIIVPKNKAIVRDDNNKILSIHGEGYFPYQNHQMVELLDKVSQQIGLPIHKGGFFGNGEKVFIQLKSDDLKLGNDRVEGYITGVNSFDGTTSLAFGPSNITISCQNSFFLAFRSLDTRVRHTKNMVLRIDEICRGIERVIDEEKVMFDNIVKLSETRIGLNDKDWVSKLLFDISKDVNLNDSEQLPTVTQNRLGSFYVDLNGELQGKGDNLWGLFSGVTKFTTHTMNKGNLEKNQENKMMGVYGKREREIFNKLVELV